jgi:signal peptidase I
MVFRSSQACPVGGAYGRLPLFYKETGNIMNPLLAQSASTTETPAAEVLANISVVHVVLFALTLTLLRLLLRNVKVPAQDGSAPETAGWAQGLSEILESLVLAGVLVFLIIRPFLVQAFYIPSASMENTLMGHDAGEGYRDTIHDHLFVNKLAFRLGEPQRNDIIVFKAPKEADHEDLERGLPQKENILIKRLIGLPHDTIEVKPTPDGMACAVYRNGEMLKEPFIKEPIMLYQDGKYATRGPITLGPGQLFVMGDNRNNSSDSRFWGVLDRSRVIGKAAMIFYPFDRIRLLP